MIYTKRSFNSLEKKALIKDLHNPILAYSSAKLCEISSMTFANLLNKTHGHLLRDIRNMKCSSKFKDINFTTAVRIAGNNRVFQYYNISQKGAALLYSNYRLSDEYKELVIEKIFSP